MKKMLVAVLAAASLNVVTMFPALADPGDTAEAAAVNASVDARLRVVLARLAKQAHAPGADSRLATR